MKKNNDPLRDFGAYVFAHTAIDYPYDETFHYAPRLHIQAYHESPDDTIYVDVRGNEVIGLSIPEGCKYDDTTLFVSQNEFAFFAKLDEVLSEQYNGVISPLNYDSTVPYLGRELPIRKSQDVKLDDDAFYLPEGLSEHEIRMAFLDMLAIKAYAYLYPKIEHYAKMMGLEYSGLEIDDGRRTFGSFHQFTKEIFLSRRLLMIRAPVIDFLIVHELAHNVSISHSREHDTMIEKILPNYEELDDEFNDTCGELIKKGWL